MTSAGPQPFPGYPGVTIERNVPATMRDGMTLMADVYRPAEPGEFPVILMRLPYDKTQAENITYAHPAWYARHGYIVVVAGHARRGTLGGRVVPRSNTRPRTATTRSSGRHACPAPTVGSACTASPTRGRRSYCRPRCDRRAWPRSAPAMTASQYYEGWTYNQGALGARLRHVVGRRPGHERSAQAPAGRRGDGDVTHPRTRAPWAGTGGCRSEPIRR